MVKRGSGDPLLKGRQWQVVRAYWIALRRPCARCGGWIDYEDWRSPVALDVGHIVSRHEARAMGWSADRINDIANTQPECRACSRSAGAKMRNAMNPNCRPMPIESGDW